MSADTVAREFERTFGPLREVGRDAATGAYTRLAWTAEDATLRAWFAAEAGRRGLAVSADRNANLWAWWGEPADGAVVTGSHLDSVPGGGAYDGPLGVASALCALDVLRARGSIPLRPLAVVMFADEEGGRFGVACAGSRLLTGSLDPGRARRLQDTDGVTLGAAARAAGADPDRFGRDEPALRRIGAFVELHVEQGRALADLDAPVGVATGIWPHGRWRLAFSGASDHAGTTRLADRRDPVVALAATVLAARQTSAGLGALATIGRISVRPGASNAVAATGDAWLDARAADDATLDRLLADIVAAARSAAAAETVDLLVTEESRSPAVGFDPSLRKRVAAAVARVTGSAPLLPTGAGHDAGVLAAYVPSAMIFVRNPTGTSHSPAEHAEPADCVTGIRALAAVLEELAGR